MTIEDALRDERLGSLPISSPACVRTGTSLQEALETMRREATGCILVCDGERLVGIFTERDALNKLFGRPVDLATPIERFMTADPQTLSVEDRLGDAIRLMTERGYRHIPLREPQGKRAGMIASQDIVHYVAEHFPAEVVNLPPALHQDFHTPEGA